MARTVGIGIQDFEKIIENECFYVDKTDFIREWWERKDDVTLITRESGFGRSKKRNMIPFFWRTALQKKISGSMDSRFRGREY